MENEITKGFKICPDAAESIRSIIRISMRSNGGRLNKDFMGILKEQARFDAYLHEKGICYPLNCEVERLVN